MISDPMHIATISPAIFATPTSYGEGFTLDRAQFTAPRMTKRRLLLRSALDGEFPPLNRQPQAAILWVMVTALSAAIHRVEPVWVGYVNFARAPRPKPVPGQKPAPDYAAVSSDDEIAHMVVEFARCGGFSEADYDDHRRIWGRL